MPLIDTYTAAGLPGHWHRSLELPCGYQHFNWYKEGDNQNGVYLNDPLRLKHALRAAPEWTFLLYTQHQIMYQDGILKQTRSSPNWEGGLVTYATCKHHARTTNRDWEGVWLAGLCPRECADNCLLFVGQIKFVFHGNYALGRHLAGRHPAAYKVKRANTNPRGDVYVPTETPLSTANQYSHYFFQEPPRHTRSVEFYKKSPGSTSDRPDGKIPKWWRDLEYVGRSGIRPPCFVLDPCYLFGKPLLWSRYEPKRATLNISPRTFLDSLYTK